MKNKIVMYAVALAFAMYILIEMVNWSSPKFFDYSMIVIYAICVILAALNVVLYFKKRG
ncbi:hypothetical protein [Lysinibacillus telephonicus]|uniref:hypothetical protein n=1 Tax=Lysinibacillus telephonicus TaxID=1714840 RepID=UPI003BA035F9